MELIEKIEAKLELFNFDLHKFQLIVYEVPISLVGTFAELWYPGNELCMVMGYKNVKQTLINNIKAKHKITLAELEKVVQSDCTTFFWPFSDALSFNDGEAVYISEYGVYRLAMKCQPPIGENFREWLAEDANQSEELAIQGKQTADQGEQPAIQDEQIEKLCEKVAVMTIRNETKHIFQLYKHRFNNEYIFIRAQIKYLPAALRVVNLELFDPLIKEINVPNAINILNRLKEKLREQKIFFEASTNKLTVDVNVVEMVDDVIVESRT